MSLWADPGNTRAFAAGRTGRENSYQGDAQDFSRNGDDFLGPSSCEAVAAAGGRLLCVVSVTSGWNGTVQK